MSQHSLSASLASETVPHRQLISCILIFTRVLNETHNLIYIMWLQVGIFLSGTVTYCIGPHVSLRMRHKLLSSPAILYSARQPCNLAIIVCTLVQKSIHIYLTHGSQLVCLPMHTRVILTAARIFAVNLCVAFVHAGRVHACSTCRWDCKVSMLGVTYSFTAPWK